MLELCRELAGAETTAATAVARWEQLDRAMRGGSDKRELRFRRRAYERARERALVALLMGAHSSGGRARRAAQRRTRLGLLLRRHVARR